MAEAYRKAIADMEAGVALLQKASSDLLFAFGQGARRAGPFDYRDKHRGTNFDLVPKDIELEWRKTAWEILVDRMELKRVCSCARAAEIDKQINDPKTLPEITEANMLAMLSGAYQNLGDFLQEAVVEVFERLRPWQPGGNVWKTNKVFEVGPRVVLNGYIEMKWGGGFRCSYYSDRTQVIRCLDNVMHLLDGKGPVPTHAGPLVDALNSPANNGRVETEYFEAKCFKRGTLHLHFKRADLLAELNLRGSKGSPQLPMTQA